MATHAGADLAPIGRLHADMSILKWGGGVIGQLGLGLLAVNLMSPYPDSARQPLAQWLQPQIDQWTAAYHATVQSVHIGEGTLVLSGTRH